MADKEKIKNASKNVVLKTRANTPVSFLNSCGADKKTTDPSKQADIENAKKRAILCADEFLKNLDNPQNIQTQLKKWFQLDSSDKDGIKKLKDEFTKVNQRLKDSELIYTGENGYAGRTSSSDGIKPDPNTKIGEKFFDDNSNKKAKTIIHEAVHGSLKKKDGKIVDGVIREGDREAYYMDGRGFISVESEEDYDLSSKWEFFKGALISGFQSKMQSIIEAVSIIDPGFVLSMDIAVFPLDSLTTEQLMELPDAYGYAVMESCTCSKSPTEDIPHK